MPEVQNIQWFPGHMAKTRRLIQETLPLVDLVAEIIDARIPQSSRNPDLDSLLQAKPRMVLLNKCDMADDTVTGEWLDYLKARHASALPVDCRSGKGLSAFLPAVRTILRDRLDTLKQKGMAGRTLRVMVVGIPNAGKSSFINRMVGGGRAKVENRPGVTRGNQWFFVDKGIELLDTPGVLWPKFDDPVVGEHLAFTGAVKDSVFDTESLALRLLDNLVRLYPHLLFNRYPITNEMRSTDSYTLLEEIGRLRGMRISRGEIDTERAAAMLLEEFRNAKIGRISLEHPCDYTK